MLLILNIVELIEQPHLKKIEGKNLERDYRVILEADDIKSLIAVIPYEFKQSYTFIRQAKLDGSTYSIGTTYGILPEVMNGLSAQTVHASYEIYAGQKHNTLNSIENSLRIDMIDADHRIEAVMLGNLSGKQDVVEELRKRGWNQLAEFKNIQYGTTVLIMRRPKSG